MAVLRLTKTKKPGKKPFFIVDTAYVGESIDLKLAQESMKQYNLLTRDHPLVLRLLDDQYAVLTKFGAVSFWNVSDKLKAQFLRELAPTVKKIREDYPYREKTRVVINAETERVMHNKVALEEFELEKMRIISYVLSQSVALERYENEIEENLRELGIVIDNLKTQGRALMRERELLQQIGKVLSVKQVAVAHLSLFDKPDAVWDSEELERLFNQLHKEYELGDRFDILDEKINFLSDNAKMLMDFISEKRNAFLEMIIIVLIVIELIPAIITLIKDLHK